MNVIEQVQKGYSLKWNSYKIHYGYFDIKTLFIKEHKYRSKQLYIVERLSDEGMCLNFFHITFCKPMFQLFLRHPERKVLDPNGPNISMSLTKIGNVTVCCW